VILADHHTHHVRCGHAAGSIEEYIQAALALGLEEIGITDHAPLYWMEGDHPWPGSAMARSELPHYVEEVLLLKRRYAGRIRVLLGLESDYAPGFEDFYRDLRAAYPWDYWIGSVHQLLGSHIYQAERWNRGADPAEVYTGYFRLVRKSARSGLFDVLGHITGIMALSPRPTPELLEREFEQTVRAIAETGVAVEVNTSGLRKGLLEPFPAGPLLRRLRDAGVPLTYGSDSHLPSEVGHGRELAAELLEGAVRWQPGSRTPQAAGTT